MVSAHVDQAEGLRRMLSFARTRTVAVVAGTRGAGTTSCVVNLAAALAAEGRRVLVVDENYGTNVSHALGLSPRFDLEDAIAGECELSDALLRAPCGITILAAAEAARTLPQLDARREARAIRCFAQLDSTADIVLLDVCNDADEPSPFAAAAQEVIVVVSPGSSSITGGYAAVKRMSRTHGRKRFRLLVNGADDEAARLVHGNMTSVAAKHLGVALEYIGAIPFDPVVQLSARRFSAAVDAAPTTAASRRFCEHGAAILRWSAPQNEVSRLDNFMQRAIYGSRFQAVGAGV